jgi:hypothetical protein
MVDVNIGIVKKFTIGIKQEKIRIKWMRLHRRGIRMLRNLGFTQVHSALCIGL